ncbi:FAD-dependent monooxygenase [Streptomyces sp. BK340]|uniref:FAD-dependent monooxygenase n=1 Tax=Streptomyces sp. BK340 TaxID=2572903 RepID=UPI0011AC0613|nr:FAD-dependent monooxygenase [Streptomyces sp. BK340]TVZ90134.1 FAD binding domain-containing protein [Streptomyces sp. BK340]
MTDTAVLIAGTGPVGLTAALELSRRGVACRLVDRLAERAETARGLAHDRLTCYCVPPEGVDAGPLPLPVLRDGRGEFRERYGASGSEAFLVRPDGCLGARVPPAGPGPLRAALTRVFAPGPVRA